MSILLELETQGREDDRCGGGEDGNGERAICGAWANQSRHRFRRLFKLDNSMVCKFHARIQATYTQRSQGPSQRRSLSSLYPSRSSRLSLSLRSLSLRLARSSSVSYSRSRSRRSLALRAALSSSVS